MSKELKIITVGDIFANLETEEKAIRFLKYIKELQQKENIIKEVRELANKEDFTMKQKYEMRESILEILDKENK